MSDPISPCPWCGEAPRFRCIEESGDTCIDCKGPNCPVHPTTHYRKDAPADMIDAWNHRIPDASLAADLARAAEYLVQSAPLGRGKESLDAMAELAARLRAHAKRIGGETE